MTWSSCASSCALSTHWMRYTSSGLSSTTIRFSQRQELRIVALEYKDLYIVIVPGNPATHSSAVFQRLTGVLTASELHDGCGGGVSIARGNVNVNVVPCPSTLSTLTCPPCAV